MSNTTGNIVLFLGSDSVDLERSKTSHHLQVSLKPHSETSPEWPEKCLDLLTDPKNNLLVITELGNDTKLIGVPKGQQATWIERFNEIEGIAAHAETMVHLLAP